MAARYGTRKDGRVYPKRIFTDTIEGVSKVHGIGQFALRDLRFGDMVRDPHNEAGFNHSADPNVVRVVNQAGQYVGTYVLRNIRRGEEMFMDYKRRGRIADDGSVVWEDNA